MKINILTIGLIGVFIVWAANADEYTLAQSDANGIDHLVGQECSTEGKKLIKCGCPSPGIAVTELCSTKNWISASGCKLEDTTYDGGYMYCVDAEYDTVCHLCRCNNGQTYSAWTNTGSGNRVSRTKYTTTVSSGYICNSSSSTEYGCAANYYQSAGSGASMTCTKCPSSGGNSATNSSGTTDITSCCLSSGASFSDTAGSGTWTSSCCYTK